MKNVYLKWLGCLIVGFLLIFAAGCKKKVAVNAPSAPPIVAPTASISADPNSIERGQSSTLRWETSNANDITIEGIGKVDANGMKTIAPSDSTTYQLNAKGPGGTASASARVTVTLPPPPPPTPQAMENETDLFGRSVKSIFFDFDKSDIRGDQQASIDADAHFLESHSGIKFTVEGHCDERGSIEYNLALGDRRANSVKEALVRAGVNAQRIHTVTYGKERPFCNEHNEDCWQENRQGHFVYQPEQAGADTVPAAPSSNGSSN